jgi:hypothetical protein
VDDLIFQQLYGYQYGTKYLTDLPGEAEFLGASSPNDELRRKTAALCGELVHSVPLLREVPLPTVLRIRQEDPGSLVLYRQAYVRYSKSISAGTKRCRNAMLSRSIVMCCSLSY